MRGRLRAGEGLGPDGLGTVLLASQRIRSTHHRRFAALGPPEQRPQGRGLCLLLATCPRCLVPNRPGCMRSEALSISCHPPAMCAQPVALAALETCDRGHSLSSGCSVFSQTARQHHPSWPLGHQAGHPPTHSHLAAKVPLLCMRAAVPPRPSHTRGPHGLGSPGASSPWPGSGLSVLNPKVTSRGLCFSLLPSE